MSVQPGENLIHSHGSLLREFEQRLNPSCISWLEIWQYHGEVVGKEFFGSSFFHAHDSYYVLYEHPTIAKKREFVEITNESMRNLIDEHTCDHSCGVELDVIISPKSMREYLICNHDGEMLHLSPEALRKLCRAIKT